MQTAQRILRHPPRYRDDECTPQKQIDRIPAVEANNGELGKSHYLLQVEVLVNWRIYRVRALNSNVECTAIFFDMECSAVRSIKDRNPSARDRLPSKTFVNALGEFFTKDH